ncbi:hypothetical protein TB1_000542 [Malus domestica]
MDVVAFIRSPELFSKLVLIGTNPGTVPGKIFSFVGCHMDAVTVNPKDWEFDPFSLGIEGDKLRGLGTTDCLGHVALLTELMRMLAKTKPKLKSTMVTVFIAKEENSSISGVGMDALVKDGLVSNRLLESSFDNLICEDDAKGT